MNNDKTDMIVWEHWLHEELISNGSHLYLAIESSPDVKSLLLLFPHDITTETRNQDLVIVRGQ